MKNKIAHYSGALLIGGVFVFSQLCSAQTADLQVLDIAVTPATDAAQPIPASVVSGNRGRISFIIDTINGQPAGGSFIDGLRPSSPILSGPALPALETWVFDLRQADGTPIGTIVASGAPGAQEFTIVSGTGVYEDVQGTAAKEYGAVAPAPLEPQAPVSQIRYSIPWYRLTLDPAQSPQIAQTPQGPALVHAADASTVTAQNPIHPGEALTIYALDLLPADARGASAILPVSVTIGEQSAAVLWAGRYQDSQNGFQINVRVPQGLMSGFVDVSLAVGFLAAPTVQAALEAN